MDDKELPVDYFAPIVTISERPPPKIRKIKIKIEPNEEGEMSGEIVRPRRRGRPRKDDGDAAALHKKKKKKTKKGRPGEEGEDDSDWSSRRRRKKTGKGEREPVDVAAGAPEAVEVKTELPEDAIKEEIKEEPSDELCVEVPMPEDLKHVGVATRQDDKKFKCPLCTKDPNEPSKASVVYTQKELKQHYKHSHPGKRLRQSRFSNEVHPCDVCGKEFRSASAVKDHVETHNNYFYCDVCNASQKKILEHIVHLRVHSGSFRCLMCDFSTPDINAITDHVNNHEDSFNRFFPDVEVEMKIGDDVLRCFDSDADASSAKKSSSDDGEDEEYTPPGGRRRRKPRRRKAAAVAVEKVKRQEHKVWTCKRCLEEFESRRHLTDHTKTYHAKDEEGEGATFKYDEAQDIYVCSTCSAEYQTKDEVLEHVTKVHEEFYTCEVCEHTAKKAYNFAVHVKTHNPEEIYSCPLCSYSTPRRTCLRTHIDRMHYHKFYYTCATCGKGFNDSAIFKEHNNEHLGVKPFVCVVCNKTFVYSRYMLIHQTRYHTVHIEGTLHKTQCSICLKVFSKVPTLLKHITTKHSMSSTTPEKRHLCDMCGKGFGTSDKLKIHYRIHTGDKPFACRYCSKRFTKRDYLVMHERVHTGEKPYICKFCGKCFNQAASLRIHVRGHTGERPYVCEFCNVGYISRGSLNIHMKICKALF